MHPASLGLMRKARGMIRDILPERLTVLDVGGRNNSAKERSYIDVWGGDADHYWVADILDAPNVTHHMDEPYRILIDDDTADLVVSGQTLEHVHNPFRLVAEMVRILKPGGFIVLIAPSSGYTHEPVDCWRFYRDAFTGIADEVGLTVVADWIYTGDSGGDRGRLWDDHVFVGRKPA